MEWRIPELIALKSEGKKLNDDQIRFLVKSISDHSMEDLQLGKNHNF